MNENFESTVGEIRSASLQQCPAFHKNETRELSYLENMIWDNG